MGSVHSSAFPAYSTAASNYPVDLAASVVVDRMIVGLEHPGNVLLVTIVVSRDDFLVYSQAIAKRLQLQLTPVRAEPKPAPPVTFNNSPGSAVSINQQGGITAGTVNTDTHPHLVMTDIQRDLITDAMKPYTGKSAFILVNGGTNELLDFGNKVNAALGAAGIKTEIHQGMAFSEGSDRRRALFVGFKSSNADMANALINATINSHILSGAQVSYHQYGNESEDKLQIIISPLE